MTQSNDHSDKKVHQQQILFSDNDLSGSNENSDFKESHEGKQVIFDNLDYLAVDETPDLPAESSQQALANTLSSQGKKSRPRWLWRIVLVLFTIIVGVEAFDFFTQGFEQSPILTSMYALIFTCLIVLASSTLLGEWSTLRQFKRREKLKQQASELLAVYDTDKVKPTERLDVERFCQKITESLPCDLLSETEIEHDKAWQDALNSHHSPNELLQLYSRQVLTKVDEKAMAEIARFSTEAVVLVALSPVAIIDMLIILWRNLRMINKVAGLYGLKLGYWSRIKLIRQVFVNMVYAGASELIADFGTDMIGADLLGKLSGRLAQGLGAGMLTARLGLKTMQLCRPIEFEEKPKLTHVRKQMLTTIKGLISRKV
ncbi:YcjF family protein [Colwellia sp. KU-HH00111]|uniref:YcjF family protein n=1 Tax=Colwellia sp. KU-HH00111 TaxID=3127652 RepID=UPI00310C504C